MSNKNIFNGFLKTQGTKIINGVGDQVLLKGWGLGNWMLCEGYMWLSDGSTRLDRPNRIEQVIKELIGEKDSKKFWQKFLDDYISEADIRHMKELGYNSIRIPFNWRHFFEDEPGIVWKEEGFGLLEKCVNWCERYGLYAFFDLHGAPGGQTGANIDDCVDDVPRLFLEEDKWEKALALWEELAKRYKDNWTVGGYDLLNEPIRPAHGEMVDYDYLLPKLIEFYEEAIKRIRKHDDKHLISIEGHHWSTDIAVFDRKYDDNYVIHFHRYACFPERKALDEWLSLSEKWEVPLWLGETGENKPEWFSAFFQLSIEFGIGYNLWPYKKMGRANCPINVKTPKDWDMIINYSKGQPHPGYEKASEILNEFLENIRFENCILNQSITNHALRFTPYSIRATDFDERLDGYSAYSGRSKENEVYYREGCCLKIIEEYQPGKKEFFFDTLWDRYLLELKKGEYVTYSVNDVKLGSKVKFEGFVESSEVVVEVIQNNEKSSKINFSVKPEEKTEFDLEIDLIVDEKVNIRINVVNGKIWLRRVHFV